MEPELEAADTYGLLFLFQRLVYEGGKVGEEFVETEYYKDLGGVGKQHHTVGHPWLITPITPPFLP